MFPNWDWTLIGDSSAFVLRDGIYGETRSPQLSRRPSIALRYSPRYSGSGIDGIQPTCGGMMHGLH